MTRQMKAVNIPRRRRQTHTERERERERERRERKRDERVSSITYLGLLTGVPEITTLEDLP